MSEKKVFLTREGLKKLETELHDLKTIKRKEVAEKIKEARGQGDLSENAEYDSAKEEQAEIEARIVVLEKMLRNAEIILEEEISTDMVSAGSKVTIFDYEFDEEVTYTIVGSAEADPMECKISNESPLGSTLLGHKVGDELLVNSPAGDIKVKIVKIGQ